MPPPRPTSTSVDFPIPGSPPTHTTPPRPAATCGHRPPQPGHLNVTTHHPASRHSTHPNLSSPDHRHASEPAQPSRPGRRNGQLRGANSNRPEDTRGLPPATGPRVETATRHHRGTLLIARKGTLRRRPLHNATPTQHGGSVSPILRGLGPKGHVRTSTKWCRHGVGAAARSPFGRVPAAAHKWTGRWPGSGRRRLRGVRRQGRRRAGWDSVCSPAAAPVHARGVPSALVPGLRQGTRPRPRSDSGWRRSRPNLANSHCAASQ